MIEQQRVWKQRGETFCSLLVTFCLLLVSFSLFINAFYLFLVTLLVKQPPEFFQEKRHFQNFRKNHRKTPCPSLFLNLMCGPETVNFIKKRLWHRCFPANFVKIFKNTYFEDLWTTASGCRLDSHIEIESQRYAAFHLSFVYINMPVAGSFPSFIYDFFTHICLGFDETKFTKGKIIWRTSAGSKI